MKVRINEAQDIIDRSFLPTACRPIMLAMLEEIVECRHNHQVKMDELRAEIRRLGENQLIITDKTADKIIIEFNTDSDDQVIFDKELAPKVVKTPKKAKSVKKKPKNAKKTGKAKKPKKQARDAI